MKFEFLCDWQEAPAEIRLASHRATWAHLTLGIDDRLFTTNEPLNSDDETFGQREFISVSAFPLAEFIAANWWPMLYEPQEKEKLLMDPSAFKERHWIDKHTDGFAYPTLGFFGADTSVRLVARVSNIESANIQFPVKSGGADVHWDVLERHQVEEALLSFLAETVERLPANEDKTWLKDMVARIRNAQASPDEALYCRCAGLLGADPFEPGDELETAIEQTVNLLGQQIAMEMFSMAEATDVADRATWLHQQTQTTIKKSREVAAHADSLRNKIQAIRKTGKPWDRGYAAAKQLRELLRMTPDTPLPTSNDVTRVLLGGSTAPCSIDNMEARCGARGIACKSADGFGIALENSSTPQFQLAATFSDFLFSADNEMFLSTRASTDRQKTNRAFAAEFLAPIDGIKDKWSKKKTHETNIDDIAKCFGISSFIVRYQVQNQAEQLLL